MTLAHQTMPEFADLLRGWRKNRKLSQGNLALNAGISQRHLSFLESSRSSPSREMVLLLAEALELPLREQNAMLNAAGFANVFPHRSLDQAELKHAERALSIMLEHANPNPAIVIDRNWNILLANDATNRVFSRFVDPVQMWVEIGGKVPNMLRATLHPLGFRSVLGNWQELAGFFLSHLSQELASNPYNHEARSLLDEITAYPGMPESGISPNGSRPWIALQIGKDGLNLEFFSMISTFGTPLDVTLQEIRIETFFPADDITADWLTS